MPAEAPWPKALRGLRGGGWGSGEPATLPMQYDDGGYDVVCTNHDAICKFLMGFGALAYLFS